MWYGDGTFEVTPPLFYQFFVILSHRFGSAHLMLYVLLPNITAKTHRTLFEGIKILDASDNLTPETFNCRFEIAFIKEI